MNNFNFDLDNTIDEDFFGSLKGKSKLKQLFGDDSISQDEKQQSLKYQRPKATDLKQSTNNDSTDSSASSSHHANITLMAKVVVAYKHGELQGKVGLALIQNSDSTCGLIIYKTKALILATLKLEPGQEVLFKQTKYWQFYDESIYWSFSFDAQLDEDEFIKKLKSKELTFKESKEDTSQKQEEIKNYELKQESIKKNVQDESILTHSTMSSSKESKNSLIKRMAKMGKPLPTLYSSTQQTTTEFSDSSDTEVVNTPLSLAQKPSIAPRSSKLSYIKPNQQLVPTAVTYSSGNTSNGTVYPINPMESQYMQMLLTEQRTQGSELRMNMNKLENKIEKVLDKLELFDKHDGKEKPHKDDEILELEEKLLMLKKENRKLKQSLEEKTYNRDSEEKKTKEILQYFSNDFKRLNIDYTQDLPEILKELTDKLKNLQEEKQSNQEKMIVMETKLRELELELASEKSSNNDKEKQLITLQENEQIIKTANQEKDKQIKEYEQQIKYLNEKCLEKSKEPTEISADSMVKAIMNNLYTDITDKLERSQLGGTEKILSLVASSIRQQTLKSLQQSTTK